MATQLFSKLGGIDPENCHSIEPPSYASAAYVIASYGPRFFPTVSLKFGQLARIFWANVLPPPLPLAKNCPYAYGFTNSYSKRQVEDKQKVNLFTSLHSRSIFHFENTAIWTSEFQSARVQNRNAVSLKKVSALDFPQ